MLPKLKGHGSTSAEARQNLADKIHRRKKIGHALMSSVLGAAGHAFGEEASVESLEEKEARKKSDAEKREQRSLALDGQDSSSGGGGFARGELRSIGNKLSEIAEGVNKIVSILREGGNRVADKPNQAITEGNEVSADQSDNDNTETPVGFRRPPRMKAWAPRIPLPEDMPEVEAANSNKIISGLHKDARPQFFGNTIQNTEVASTNGESPTSAYRQNEKEVKDNKVVVNSFGSEALKQLADIFGKANGNLKDDGFKLPSLPVIPPLRNPFGGKGGKNPKPKATPKAGVKPNQISAAAAKPARTPGAKSPPVRGPDGRFVKAAAAQAPSALSRVGGAMKGAGSKLGGIASLAGKGLGVAGVVAAPVLTAMDYQNRKEAGQTTKQAALGAGGGLAGGFAGAMAGAQGGALIGGGIGALGGGIGAIPGAAIGGVVGMVGGGIAGSGIGSWLADKYTGADKNKPGAKVIAPTAQTKDIAALEKTKQKQVAEQHKTAAQPPVIVAPSTTNVVQNSNHNMLGGGGGGSSRGPRGSLDLSQY